MSMKILVLGADGMLGHQVVAYFGAGYVVGGTLRRGESAYSKVRAHLPPTAYFGVDARDFQSVVRVLDEFRPDAVVNAIGIVKQRDESKDVLESLEINSLLPHRLAEHCERNEIRMVHLSTDCVFSGGVGDYGEDSRSDAYDVYGKTKFLGEVSRRGVFTLRTSIIGLELARRKSLVEWFLAQQGSVSGYVNAIYTGFTTLEMARIIELVIRAPSTKAGLYNVSSEKISKFELLHRLGERLQLGVDVRPEYDFRCDRSLDSTRFRTTFAYTPPSWDQMLDELAEQIRARAEHGI